MQDDQQQSDVSEGSTLSGGSTPERKKKGNKGDKTSPRYKLMSVPLDESEKAHLPKNAKGAIAFVGISVGTADFEGENFWEICRAIVDAGYEEIVLVVGGVLQRHNAYTNHVHKRVTKDHEVTEEEMTRYQKDKTEKKKDKALKAEKAWIERHQDYIEQLQQFGKKVTLIEWNDILEGKHGDFKASKRAIDEEFAKYNGIRTYVKSAAHDMYSLRKKQTRDMTQTQKSRYNDAFVNLEGFLKTQNEDYFKEETAAFRMLAKEHPQLRDRLLHYIYPNKNEIGENFLRAVRRALELIGKKDQMEFYSPENASRAKREDKNRELHEQLQELQRENDEKSGQLAELLGELDRAKRGVDSRNEKQQEIDRLSDQIKQLYERLTQVSKLVSELCAATALKSLPAEMRADVMTTYAKQLAGVMEPGKKGVGDFVPNPDDERPDDFARRTPDSSSPIDIPQSRAAKPPEDSDSLDSGGASGSSAERQEPGFVNSGYSKKNAGVAVSPPRRGDVAGDFAKGKQQQLYSNGRMYAPASVVSTPAQSSFIGGYEPVAEGGRGRSIIVNGVGRGRGKG